MCEGTNSKKAIELYQSAGELREVLQYLILCNKCPSGNAPNLSILLCLMPDYFTSQGESYPECLFLWPQVQMSWVWGWVFKDQEALFDLNIT
jgi:hypothetical protein